MGGSDTTPLLTTVSLAGTTLAAEQMLRHRVVDAAICKAQRWVKRGEGGGVG